MSDLPDDESNYEGGDGDENQIVEPENEQSSDPDILHITMPTDGEYAPVAPNDEAIQKFYTALTGSTGPPPTGPLVMDFGPLEVHIEPEVITHPHGIQIVNDQVSAFFENSLPSATQLPGGDEDLDDEGQVEHEGGQFEQP